MNFVIGGQHQAADSADDRRVVPWVCPTIVCLESVGSARNKPFAPKSDFGPIDSTSYAS